MLSISNRGQKMPQSPIRKLAPYALQAEKEGVKIYHLNIGQPDINTPREAIEAVQNTKIDLLPYTQSDGVLSLRKALKLYYNEHNIKVSTDDIIVTTGASEAIFFLMNTIADIGDEFIIPEPFYANYLGFATASDINIKPIPSTFEGNFALPSIKDFERCITDKTKAILICNPGNPTGALCSKSEILQLAAIAKKHQLYLIADEIYREFIYDGDSHYSILQIPDFKDYTVMIDSVSKRYSMCGSRIGCVVTKNKHLKEHMMKFAQARLSPPIYGQIAAEAALGVKKNYYNEVVDEYRQRRNLLVSELQKIPRVQVSIPKGAFYCIANLPIRDTNDFAQWLLEYFRYDKQTLMIAPGSGFYITPNKGKQQVRLAYVLCKEDLKQAVYILRKALEVYSD